MKSQPISPKLANVTVPEGATAAETLAIYEKEGVIADLSDDQYYELAVAANKEEGISTGSTANGNSNRVGLVTVNGESFGNGGFDISRKGLKELYQGGMLDTVGNVSGGMYDSEIRDIMGRDDFGSFSRELNYELENAFGLNELADAMGFASVSNISGVFYKAAKAGIQGIFTQHSRQTFTEDSVIRRHAAHNPWRHFRTAGIDKRSAMQFLQSNPNGQSLVDEIVAGKPNWGPEQVLKKALEIVQSGKNLPEKIKLSKGTKLYKITKGDSVHPSTEYFTTYEELMSAKGSGNIANYFGLPKLSGGEAYNVFEITAEKSATVFRSKVAPITDGLLKRDGGGIQYVVPNRTNWSDNPVFIRTVLNEPHYE